MSKSLRLSGKERSLLYATTTFESHGLRFHVGGLNNVTS